MAKSDAVNPPEYRAWLIRNAGKAVLITGLGAGAVLWPLGLLVPPYNFEHLFTRSFSLIMALCAPVYLSTVAIFLMRSYGAGERKIKTTAMIMFFSLMFLFCLLCLASRAITRAAPCTREDRLHGTDRGQLSWSA